MLENAAAWENSKAAAVVRLTFSYRAATLPPKTTGIHAKLQQTTSNMSNGDQQQGPGGQEKINTDIVTLTRYLNEEQVKHKEATGDFTYASHTAPSDKTPN